MENSTKITLRYYDIWNAWSILDKMSTIKMTAKAAYTLSRNLTELFPIHNLISEELKKLIDVYGEKDDSGRKTASKDNPAFTNEWKKLMSTEVTVELRKITVTDIHDFMSAAELHFIEFMLCEESVIITPKFLC
jgi:hypothetical protein